jgi:uncharacterized protein
MTETILPRRRDGLALVFAMVFPSLMSWIEFWVLPGGGQSHDSALGVVFGLGKVVQFTFPMVYVWLVAPGELQVARPHTRGMGLAVGFALVVAAGVFALYFPFLKHTYIFADTPGKLDVLLDKFHGNTPGTFFSMAIFVSVFHSILEEYYWRWFVFGRLQRYLPLGAALLVSSLAFMAHHVFLLAYFFPGRFWVAAVPFSLCVAGGGIAWAWLYHRYQSLYAPWVSHLLADAAIMVVGYDMVSKYWQNV